jgi:hypothetical protein
MNLGTAVVMMECEWNWLNIIHFGIGGVEFWVLLPQQR